VSRHYNPLAGGRKDDDQRVSLGRAKILSTSDKAIRVLLDSDGKTLWVPESQVHDCSEVFKGCDGPGDLVVTLWWAEKEGLA
jgi:hypothetical protein